MNEAYDKTNNFCLIFITACFIAVTLSYTRSALIPFVFAVFAYATLTPLVNWIQNRLRVPRLAAISFALVVLLIALTGVVVVIVYSVDNFINGVSQYQESIENTIHVIEAYMVRFNIKIDFDKIRAFVLGLPIFDYVRSFTGQILSGLGSLFLVFIFTIFLLAGEKVRKKPASALVNQVLNNISAYISTKFALSFATGFLVWLVLMLFNVEMAFIFALLTIMLNFIPTIGSLIAILLPIPILILQFQFSWPFWVVLVLTSSIQFLIGNVIEPMIMGESLDLHPITILICLIFWGIIWGVAGMFLAVPITAILKIIFSRLPSTQSISELMAGRIGSPHMTNMT